MPAKRKATPKIDPRFAWFRLRVGRSGIHQWGVYAEEEIPRGKKVIEYTGRRMPIGKIQDLKPPADWYLVGCSDHEVLDGRYKGSGAERVNHSCNPNLSFKKSRGRVFFYSVRRIRKGEELTIRYAYPVKLTRVPCTCGARNCRRTLRYILE